METSCAVQPARRSLLTLFRQSLIISAFTFGGGFVIVTLMKKKYVDTLHWLTEQEMLDMTALAQSSPGAIAVNAAILVGWRVRGLWGMLTAVLGTILPPMITLSIVSLFYTAFAANPYVSAVLSGMQAGVAAVLADVVLSMGGKVVRERSRLQIAVMAAAFVASYVFGVNVALIILCCAAAGVIRALTDRRKEADKPCT